MPLSFYVCTNCGFWQKHFAMPLTCPVCTDVRHVLPDDGWDFRSEKQIAASHRTIHNEVQPGVTMFTTEPRIGIAPAGYLIETDDDGNILFEATNWYDDDALALIEARGARFLSASHPHAYGAGWQLQRSFDLDDTALHVADLAFTNGLRVSRPFDDDGLELVPGARLLHTGGHFAGHTMLYLADRRILFAGDALKFHLDENPIGISCHKAFVNRVPLSHAEIRRYRKVFASLDFTQVFTTFEHAPRATCEDALRLFDTQLAGRPFFGSVPMESLRDE